jgi:hypothetical protein|nr:conjugal transfer protein TraB [Aminobacter sp. SR38]
MAALVSVAYFLAASRRLPQGVADFYASDLWPGLLLWLFASSAFVLVHSVLWTKRDGWRRAVRFSVACGLMTIPPFGIVGWAHPLNAAGGVFPAWSWAGLVAMAAGLAVMTTWRRPAATIVLAGFWLWSVASWTDAKLPKAWHGVDLNLGSSLGREAGLQRQRDLIATVRAQPPVDARVAVLPEGALGAWTPTVERLWTRALAGTSLTIIAGATVINGEGYDNALVAISQAGGDVLYRERMPVPGSMWQPWRRWLGTSGGARAYFFANPVAGSRFAPLICYEQLVVWPVLQSMLSDPDFIVAVGNGWAGTSIVDIQRASTEAWARLFDKPLVISFNT